LSPAALPLRVFGEQFIDDFGWTSEVARYPRQQPSLAERQGIIAVAPDLFDR